MLSSCEAAYRSVRLGTLAVSRNGPHVWIPPPAYSACWSWGRFHPLLKSSPIEGEEEERDPSAVFPLPQWERTKGRVKWSAPTEPRFVDPHASIWPAAYSACWSWGRFHPLLKSSPIEGEEEERDPSAVFPLPQWERTKGRVESFHWRRAEGLKPSLQTHPLRKKSRAC